jgi:hypothetical protein
MDTHVRLLGILNIAFGLLCACFGVGTLIAYGSFGELYAASRADFQVAALAASAAFHTLVAVPCVLLGLAIMRYDDRAKSALIVVSALNLLNMPVGSIIGGYGLWVLMTPETDPLFAEPPQRKPVHKAVSASSKAQPAETTPKVKGASILRSRGADVGPH